MSGVGVVYDKIMLFFMDTPKEMKKKRSLMTSIPILTDGS